jgi:hypothetical protein
MFVNFFHERLGQRKINSLEHVKMFESRPPNLGRLLLQTQNIMCTLWVYLSIVEIFEILNLGLLNFIFGNK